MTAILDQVYLTARSLPAPDMGVLVTRLLDDLSHSLPDVSDEELDSIANEREAEMDRDPSAVVSHDEMLRFISSKRR